MVGNGKEISFWKDNWVGVSPLDSSGVNSEFDLTVADVLNVNGGWNESLISNIVSNEKFNEILNVPLPIYFSSEYSVAWVGSGSGNFSVGNCYHQILKNKLGTLSAQPSWKWLWKLKLPSRIIHFLWLLR